MTQERQALQARLDRLAQLERQARSGRQVQLGLMEPWAQLGLLGLLGQAEAWVQLALQDPQAQQVLQELTQLLLDLQVLQGQLVRQEQHQP